MLHSIRLQQPMGQPNRSLPTPTLHMLMAKPRLPPTHTLLVAMANPQLATRMVQQQLRHTPTTQQQLRQPRLQLPTLQPRLRQPILWLQWP